MNIMAAFLPRFKIMAVKNVHRLFIYTYEGFFLQDFGLTVQLRERLQMTSSQIWGFQSFRPPPPSSSDTFARPPT